MIRGQHIKLYPPRESKTVRLKLLTVIYSAAVAINIYEVCMFQSYQGCVGALTARMNWTNVLKTRSLTRRERKYEWRNLGE